jgi:hypothetical protein
MRWGRILYGSTCHPRAICNKHVAAILKLVPFIQQKNLRSLTIITPSTSYTFSRGSYFQPQLSNTYLTIHLCTKSKYCCLIYFTLRQIISTPTQHHGHFYKHGFNNIATLIVKTLISTRKYFLLPAVALLMLLLPAVSKCNMLL